MLQRSGSTHSTSKTKFTSLNLSQCIFIFYNFTAEVPKRTTTQMTRGNNTPLSMVRPFSKFWWFVLLNSCNCTPNTKTLCQTVPLSVCVEFASLVVVNLYIYCLSPSGDCVRKVVHWYHQDFQLMGSKSFDRQITTNIRLLPSTIESG